MGGVLAGLLSGGLTRLHAQGKVITWSITVWGVAVATFGAVLVVVGRHHPARVVPWALVAALVALAVGGAADSVSAVFRSTILQVATPDEYRGRIQGVFIVVVSGGPRLGELVLGGVAGRVGEQWAALGAGVACVVALWVVVAAQRTFWRYDARDPQP